MKLKKFRAQLTYLMIGCKFLLIAWAFFVKSTGNYDFVHLKEILFLIIPLFTTNIIIAIKHHIQNTENRVTDLKKEVATPVAVIGTAIPIIYMLYMGMVILFGVGNEESFRNTKEMLGWGEIIFGAYVGIIVTSIYNIGQK